MSQLSPQLRKALKASSSGGKSSSSSVSFDMKEDDFRRWVCEDVLGDRHLASTPVVTLSTIVYPLPLLARNPAYASHPLLASAGSANGNNIVTPQRGRNSAAADAADEVGAGPGAVGSWAGFAGGGQARIEALETLLTRIVLRPTLELRKRAEELVGVVREKAAAWGEKRGLDGPPRVVGLHVRTYFVKAVSDGTVSCGRGRSGRGGGGVVYPYMDNLEAMGEYIKLTLTLSFSHFLNKSLLSLGGFSYWVEVGGESYGVYKSSVYS